MEQSYLDLAFAREPWEATGQVTTCRVAVAKVCLVDVERLRGLEPIWRTGVTRPGRSNGGRHERN